MEQWEKIVQPWLGRELTKAETHAFQCYETELLDWNQRVNLTAIRDVENIRLKHFADSLSCVTATGSLNSKCLIDIGTGAGFPGIPLKIIYPDLQLTLVDSVNKKLKFCAHMVEQLQLTNVTILHDRAETLAHQAVHREQYDIAIARAVATLPSLSEYLLPFIKIGGMMIAQKGTTAFQEEENAKEAITILGGKQASTLAISIPGIDEPRYLIQAQKIKPTPDIYPRSPGTPTQKPLT